MHENEEDFENCDNPQRCLHCRKEHKTSDLTCPERSRQNNIQAILARTSLTTIEVVEKFPIHTQNYYEPLVQSAQDPTPAETFADVMSRQYKPATGIQRRKREGASPSSNNIGEQVDIYREKKQKVAEGQQTGVALFNKYKTTEAERWKDQLRQAQKTKNQQENSQQPTPSSSSRFPAIANGTEKEEFSKFVSNMIDKALKTIETM
ncbi:uncharacterized protein LOC134202807 [Armigeres subalbatus]|uniref:uncharacterized protein LOC134202807 n=1 Tax=Armigeres subalbatus TaxID=124917 RepID=UPI002ED5C752